MDKICKDFKRNDMIDRNSKGYKSNDSKQMVKINANAYVNNKPISGFQKTSFIEISDKDNNSENSLKKYGFGFKLQKSSPKVKIALQGSVTKAFSLDDPTYDRKNKLFAPIDKLEKNSCTVEVNNHEEIKFSYVEPLWSGKPDGVYKIDVLKSGVIVNTLNLSSKNYHIIGKVLSCDISLTNETISQFHAILQYRKVINSGNEKGMYIYDLSSTHGTYVNGNRIKPNIYILLHSGYIISFGNSQTKYILKIPNDNEEKEAELSFAELQELKRVESQEQVRSEKERLSKEIKERLRREKENGINWGIVDSNENSRSTESSEDSESDSEELYLGNPKKALRDWFKWQGFNGEYETEDLGLGYFSCSIELPLVAIQTMETVEVRVSGDKMKAIDECALKACQILNNFGFLKQAQEEKKSTSRNWEAVDYYDSDEDNFLDRTGVVEKKRQQRMKVAGKFESQIETHHALLDKHTKVVEKIKNVERLIALQKAKKDEKEDSTEDPLDAFMSKLETSVLNKTEIRNLKIELQNLHQLEMSLLNKIHINKSINKNYSKSNSIHKT